MYPIVVLKLCDNKKVKHQSTLWAKIKQTKLHYISDTLPLQHVYEKTNKSNITVFGEKNLS